MKKTNKKLEKWKSIVEADETAYLPEIQRMENREKIFRGKHELKEILPGDLTKETPHCRNIVSELIESQINSSIPQPKVTALRKKDEPLAQLIEDMIRNRLNKLPMEAINDLMERTVPVQGGAALLYEWDNKKSTHTTIGDGIISFRHPKQLIPQDGVTSGIEDMDHFTVKVPQTAEYIKRRYGVDVHGAGEEDPALRSPDGNVTTVADMVTQYNVYYRNDAGGIGLFSWIRDTVLEDLQDYQARHLRRCRNCGEPEPPFDVDEVPPTLDGTYPLGEDEEIINDTELVRSAVSRRDRCPYCGGTYKSTKEDSYKVNVPFTLPDETPVLTGDVIPYYKPDIYPVLLQRNVSSFGKFLGESDVDKIEDQQNTINRLYAKVLAQLLNAGSYICLPQDVKIRKDSEEGKVIRFTNISDVNGIKNVDLTSNIQPALAMIENVYSEAQQLIGVTDSFLGRKDSTATSGKAKEFSAAQAAGRLESKHVMKNEMYARLFEAIFKFQLAYADEPRPIVGTNMRGEHRDEEWNKNLFLARDDSGAIYWNTDFLFECDSTAPLAQNREAMWQEMRSHYESGALGDPNQIETRIAYWEQMAVLHYPGANRIRDILKEEKQRQLAQQLKQAQAAKSAMQQAQIDSAAAAQQAGMQQLPAEQAVPGAQPEQGGALT